jgi:hypothetical protein
LFCDQSGSLDIDEFKRLVRNTLRVGKAELTDKDLARLADLLDGDGGGYREPENPIAQARPTINALVASDPEPRHYLHHESLPHQHTRY